MTTLAAAISTTATATTPPTAAGAGSVGGQTMGSGFPPGGGGPSGGGHLLTDLVTFAHVVGVLGLFIALGVEILAVLRLRRAQSMGQVREWGFAARAMFWVHLVSTPLIWATGLYLLFAQWSLTTAWLDVSMVVMLGLSACGMWISGRHLRAIGASARSIEGESIPAALRRQIHDPVLNTLVQAIAGLALGIAYLMLLKPDLAHSLIAVVVGGLLGAASAQLTGWYDRAARHGG